MGLTDAKLNLVQTTDDLLDLKEWLGQRRKWLGADIETEGLHLGRDRTRLVQFGDLTAGWAIPYEDWRGFIREVFSSYRGRIAFHNCLFDTRFLKRDGIVVDPHLIDDTMVMAHLVDSKGSMGLKPLSARYVHPSAQAGKDAMKQTIVNAERESKVVPDWAWEIAPQKDKRTGIKWDWKTFPVDHPAYWLYSALDTCLTAALAEVLWPKVVELGSTSIYEIEMGSIHVLRDAEIRGMKVDPDYLRQKARESADVERTLSAEFEGVRLGSDAEVIAYLQREGAGALLTKRTERGRVALDEEVLAGLAATGRFPIAKKVHDYRFARKMRTSYFEKMLDLRTEDNVVHPSVKPLGARTGRMCLPTSHRILTRRGVLAVDDVKVGDLTLDEHGMWVPVLGVHRYSDQDICVFESRGNRLECTPEHKWVGYSERGRRTLAPISGSRRELLLAPGEEFDFKSTEGATGTAALIGWLVSDGRCVDGGPGVGLRAYVYQTEGKFLDQVRQAVPVEAIMYDRLTTEFHHEIRIKSRWLRPVLEREGFTLSAGLRLADSDWLPVWVASLSVNDCRSFLRSVWLADGTTANPQNKSISCGSEHLRVAIQIAAYRCGCSSHVENDGHSEWSTKERLRVKMTRARISTRYLEESRVRGDVWCVTTTSGTFTAWDRGPYLTGNSVTDPALQTIPRGRLVRDAFVARPDHKLLSADFSQVEYRLLAHTSGEEKMIDAFLQGRDLHDYTAQLAYNMGEVMPSPAQRQIAKAGSLSFAKLYGAGNEKFAATVGVTVPEAEDFMRRYAEAFPGVEAFMREVVDVVCQRAHNAHSPMGYVTTHLGRRLQVERYEAYKGVNYCLTPGTKVLTANLSWVNIETLNVGDRLIGFDEVPMTRPKRTGRGRHGGNRPRLRPSVVESTEVIHRPCVEVQTTLGPVTSSIEHLWLVGGEHLSASGGSPTKMRWCRADQLQPGDPLVYFSKPWERLPTWKAGYLSGLFDGEGHLSVAHSANVSFSQLQGPVYEQAKRLLTELGYRYSEYHPTQNSTTPTSSVRIAGVPEVCRFLGEVHPVRMMTNPNLSMVWENRVLRGGGGSDERAWPIAHVESVRSVGVSDVIAIGTSTRTFIADGFLSHNCIQGGAADVLKLKLCELAAAGLQDYILLPIHDEILFEVPKEMVASVKETIAEVMPEMHMFKVPLTIEISDGVDSWGEAK